MAVTPKLEIKQSQSLLMTPQLRQAINLLQMNNLELGELVAKELDSNPLLEKEDDKLEDSTSSEQTIDDYDTPQTSEEETFAEDIDYDTFDDADSDRAGYEPSWCDYKISSSKNIDDSDFDYLEQRVADKESVYSLLTRQIEQTFTLPKDKLIASRLTEFLDRAGYFTGDLKKISEQLKIDYQYLQSILQNLQTFEPSGIFATSLKECLSIQLADKNRLDEMMKLFLEHLELLAAGNIKALKKICSAEDDDIASMIADIKSLDPKPLAKYQTDNNSYIIPDIYVRRNKYGEYIVELNQDSLPRVLINRNYVSRITKNDKATNKYIKEHLSSANFLIKALHQRAETILRISEQIVRHQRDFFEYGIDHLHPMLLRDIAEAVEMHESTVSRATSHKYMHTPNGLFELKYFFSAASGMYNGNNQTSVTSIKHKIKQLIENEGDKILSDDAIVECLAAQSVKIARRTVAKYRDEMNIQTSAQRKRQHRNKSL